MPLIILNSTMMPKFFADYADIRVYGDVAVSFEGYLKAKIILRKQL